MTDTIAVSLLSGLVGALIGSFGTIYVGTRQIKATTISANREKWIGTLRDELAAFISQLHLLGYASSASLILQPNDLKQIMEGLHVSSARIQLMINPNEDDHARLWKLLEGAVSHVCKDPKARDQLDETGVKKDPVGDVVKQAQIVLKREWIRVKEGD